MAARTRTTALFAAQVQSDFDDRSRSALRENRWRFKTRFNGSVQFFDRVGVHLPFTSTRSSSVPWGYSDRQREPHLGTGAQTVGDKTFPQ